MGAGLLAIIVGAAVMTSATAQVPLPFPKPGQPAPSAPPPASPKPLPPTTTLPPPAAPRQEVGEPVAPSHGVAIYPAAQFITSFDAGRGQRYYLYGTTASFAEIVQYYKNTLKQRGELVFEVPAVHQFDLGRFREETMAFPPSVTVKDYSGGSGGYLNPRAGGQPLRFPTIIQVVPNPPAGIRR